MEIYAVGGHVVDWRNFCCHVAVFVSVGLCSLAISRLFCPLLWPFLSAADVVVIVIHDHVGEDCDFLLFSLVFWPFLLGLRSVVAIENRRRWPPSSPCSARQRPRFRRRVTLSLFDSLILGRCSLAVPYPWRWPFVSVADGRCYHMTKRPTNWPRQIHSKFNLIGAMETEPV